MMSEGLAVADSGLEPSASVGVLPPSSSLMEPDIISGDTSLLHLHHSPDKKHGVQSIGVGELKLEITDDDHKKDAQKEMETCFGFDVSL